MKVLIATPYTEHAGLIEGIIHRYGDHQVETVIGSEARNFEEVSREINEESFDLVIIDDDANASDLVQRFPDQSFAVLLTSGDMGWYRDRGADVVPKPFTPDVIKDLLH